ncbi:efflux RND transporter periplasmic adaptor subunit [Dryocola sp. BD613]|uniref:efflux RND transporter periplasmic adaptor subunit n=1 Tax=Dryocola sp. BD613 TaxID=3133272 RepID=UPI003F508D07
MNNMNKGWHNACVLMALMIMTLSTGTFAAAPAADAAAPAITAVPDVAAAPEATAESAAAPVRFLVLANQESPLSSVVAGRVSQVNVELGDMVKAGKLLVALDCSELKARRGAADAEYNAAQIKYEAKAKLQGLNSAGALEVGLAAADVNRTRSQIKIFEAQLAQCRFTAPFDGRVARIYVKEGQGVGAGAQIIDLVSNGTRKARLNVPSSWITWLSPGARLDAVVGETGKHYPMNVTHISGRVDAVSQTIEIETQFADDAQDVLPGMSGRATPVCPKAAAQCLSGTTGS